MFQCNHAEVELNRVYIPLTFIYVFVVCVYHLLSTGATERQDTSRQPGRNSRYRKRLPSCPAIYSWGYIYIYNHLELFFVLHPVLAGVANLAEAACLVVHVHVQPSG
jgi:hypothetical protein